MLGMAQVLRVKVPNPPCSGKNIAEGKGVHREVESGTHGCRGQESVKNYVDRMQAGLRQRLGVCGTGSAAAVCVRICADIEIARPGKAAAEEREFAG